MTHQHKWIGRRPCECGQEGPADVFAFLDSPSGKVWKAEGDEFIAARMSTLRCDECGDLLDSFGFCATHGQLDPEAIDAG